VKARPVTKLDPSQSVARSSARIVRTRLDELYSFDPAVRDPGEVVALHDMRIAAKRLRYLLELTGHVFGEAGAVAEAEAKGLQEVLGEIHDCDVLGPRVDAIADTLRDQDAEALATLAEGDPDAVAGVVNRAPNAVSYRGIESLVGGLRARRALLYRRFLTHWDELQEAGFRERLERAIDGAEGKGGSRSNGSG
jgi:hypothetical protein